MPRYGPPDAFETPRFSGPRTFMRLPHVRDLEGVDVAIVGIPTDGAVVYRSGARFGPEGIRSASVMLRNFNPLLGVDVVERLSLVDYGDVPTVPGSTADSLERSERALAEVVDAGVTTLCLGGDHTVLLAELRALARKHGPLALIQLDSHHDLWDEYFGQKLFHGSVVRRAVEEGLVDPSRSIQAGLRGSLGSAEEAGYPVELGIDALTYEELAALGPAGFSQRVRNRVGDAPCFLSFDIDFVDPAYAPGTGTPEVGGPSSREALTYVRSLAGLDFRAFDCVEVSPPFDPAGQTAFVAANACFEMLSLLALRRQP
ncbi:MAG TPA: agmatinase [Gaiellaceae bacterium]|jgi:agmatinase|nr:agmatinase [Gaiellaceae bacterium]